MSEAEVVAEVSVSEPEASTEPSEVAVESAESSIEEVQDFNLFSDSEEVSEEAPVAEVAKEEPAKEEKPRGDWSARVRKDRQQRHREIELKKREQSLTSREAAMSKGFTSEQLRKGLYENPEEFLRNAGVDPFSFYGDWTTRIASGSPTPGPEERSSAVEKELADLKKHLIAKETHEKSQQDSQRNTQILGEFHQKIDDFKSSSDKFPLTSSQCSAQDIAEGMAQYWQRTGVELNFDEAFGIIESGLVKEEEQLLESPRLTQRFKQKYGIEDSAEIKDTGKAATRTLSSNMEASPTKSAPSDMSHEEIIEHWRGKIYT
jgi:hypothetical protein